MERHAHPRFGYFQTHGNRIDKTKKQSLDSERKYDFTRRRPHLFVYATAFADVTPCGDIVTKYDDFITSII